MQKIINNHEVESSFLLDLGLTNKSEQNRTLAVAYSRLSVKITKKTVEAYCMSKREYKTRI